MKDIITGQNANYISSYSPTYIGDYRNSFYRSTITSESIFTESRLNEAKNNLRAFINRGKSIWQDDIDKRQQKS